MVTKRYSQAKCAKTRLQALCFQQREGRKSASCRDKLSTGVFLDSLEAIRTFRGLRVRLSASSKRVGEKVGLDRSPVILKSPGLAQTVVVDGLRFPEGKNFDSRPTVASRDRRHPTTGVCASHGKSSIYARR
jgi:hypothetical protein